MDYIQVISNIHAGISNLEEETQRFANELLGVEYPLAIETREQYLEEVKKIQADKNDFIDLANSDPIEAIKKFHHYLFPNQLKVKHEIKHI